MPEELKKKGGWNSKKPVAYYLLFKDGGLKNTSIAKLFGGLHPSMVGRKIKEISVGVNAGERIRVELERIRKKYENGK